MSTKITKHWSLPGVEFLYMYEYQHHGTTERVFMRADGAVFGQDGAEWPEGSLALRAFRLALGEWRESEALREKHAAEQRRAETFLKIRKRLEDV